MKNVSCLFATSMWFVVIFLMVVTSILFNFDWYSRLIKYLGKLYCTSNISTLNLRFSYLYSIGIF